MFTIKIRFVTRKISWADWQRIVDRHPRICRKCELIPMFGF